MFPLIMKILSFKYTFCIYPLTLIILLINSQSNYAQKSVSHAFHNNFVFGLDGNLTLPQTDYLNNKIGFGYRINGEYYFKTNSVHLVGLKLKLGSEQIKGEDDRGVISTQDGTRQIPPAFNTDIYTLGFEAIYSLSIGDVFFPYLSGGVSNLWFFPEDDQGIPATGGNANLYEKNTIAYSLEFGFKYLFSEKFSLNLSFNQIFPKIDYLDDIAAAFANDSYSSVVLGFSFAPFYDSDSDGDGIVGADDLCPDEHEDFDGFEDEDGCPDLDNDGDGIPDDRDNCPNQPEDFDGFEDEDGCPDLDNDGDGIPDIADKCPDEAEDFDGIQDEDGCPEFKKALNELRFIILGDEIFNTNSAMIKVEGKDQLDDLITKIQNYPGRKWRIEGHMDSDGSRSFLRSLSLQRAKAVLEYLSYFGGLERENFQVFGMGDNFPLEDNNTEEGRRKNRRIEIISEEQ